MSTTPKARTVQVPGAPVAQPVAEPQVDQVEQSAAESDTSDEVDDEKEALRAQLAEMKARLAAAEANASTIKVKASQAVATVQTAGGAKKTEQGWIVPETFGSQAKKG